MRITQRTLFTIVAGLALVAASAVSARAYFSAVLPTFNLAVPGTVSAGDTFDISGFVSDADLVTITVTYDGKGKDQTKTVTFRPAGPAPQPFKVTAPARGVGNGHIKIFGVATNSQVPGATTDFGVTTVVVARNKKK